MLDQEAEIEKLEREFPTLAASAFAAARERVLAAGLGVIESDGDMIYEVFADGRRFPVKPTEPPIIDVCGRKITIR